MDDDGQGVDATDVAIEPAAQRSYVSTDKRHTPARRIDDQKFTFLAELLPQIVWTATPDGAVDFWSRRWFEYTGLVPENSYGRSWEKVIHPEDLELTNRAWNEANRSGTSGWVEHRIRRADGEYRLHLSRYSAQVDSNGNIVRWFGTSDDIHDARQREMRLAENEKRAALSDLAHELAHDLNNPLAALLNLVYIAKAKAASEDGKQLIRQAERQVERIAGLVHSILVLGQRDIDGSYPEELDAAQLRQRKHEYEAAQHLASIVHSAQDAIYSKKMDGTVVAWNSAAERLYGYKASEIVGQNISRVIPLELLREEAEVMESLKRGESVDHHQTERLTSKGHRVRVSVSTSPVRGADNDVIGASTIARPL